MHVERLLPLVPVRWREEFRRFVQTGEASPEFLAELDQNPELQRPAQIAFEESCEEFVDFVNALHGETEDPRPSRW